MPFPYAREIAKNTLSTLKQLEEITGVEKERRAIYDRNYERTVGLVSTWPAEWVILFDQLAELTGMNDSGGSFAADVLLTRYAKAGGMPELADVDDEYPNFSNDDLRAFRDNHNGYALKAYSERKEH